MSRSQCYGAQTVLLTRNGWNRDSLLAFAVCSAPDSDRAILSARDEAASERVGDGRERVDERVVPGERVHAFSGQQGPEADGAEATREMFSLLHQILPPRRALPHARPSRGKRSGRTVADSPVVAAASEPVFANSATSRLVELGECANSLCVALERLDELVALEKPNHVVGGACMTTQARSGGDKGASKEETPRTSQNEVVLWAVECEHRPHALLMTLQGVLELPVLPDFRRPAEDADQRLFFCVFPKNAPAELAGLAASA